MYSGTNLRTLRENRGLSRNAVSERAGLSISTLARLESGLSVPSIDTLVKLANSMELPLAKLLLQIGVLDGKHPQSGRS